MSGSPRRARWRTAASLALTVSALSCTSLPVAAAQSSGSAGGAGSPVSPQTAGDGTPAASPPTPATAGHCVPSGFSPPWNWPRLSRSELDRTFAAIRATGASQIRIGMEWGNVQTSPGVWDWSTQDKVVDAASAQGLQILALVNHTPTWASRDGGDRTPPTDPAAFAEFARRAAERYGSRISHWEVWNEPNNTMFWTTGPNTAQYVRLLTTTYSAIKSVQPASTVVTAGLSPAVDAGGNISPARFVRELYDNGAAGFFDAVGMHPYGFPANPDDASTSGWNTWFRLSDVHATMAAHGDGDKKIWSTEFGAPTGTASNSVSATRQAEIYSKGLELTASTPYLGPLFFYTIRDLGTDASDVEDNFGLYRSDWSAKASAAPATSAITAHRC